MLVHQAFRFELAPNNAIRSRFASHCGASRFVYNWGLALVKDRLDQQSQIREAAFRELLSDEEARELANTVSVPWTMISLRKVWNTTKNEMAPWWGENSKFAYESGLSALSDALANFSKARSGGRAGQMGFPRFKKAGSNRSCRFWAGIAVIDSRHVRLPRIGIVRSKEMTTSLLSHLDGGTARILNATISQEADRWFISICVEIEREDPAAAFPDAVVGVDLGVKFLAVLSTGEEVENPRALNRYARRMARLQRELSRRERGSNRRADTRRRLARTHRRVRTRRADALHQLSSRLASTYGTVVLEDLNVAGMTRSPKDVRNGDGSYARNGKRAKAGLNRAILDVAPAEFRRQVTYKLAWHAGTLVIADRYFPSSKRCSSCGAVKATLSRAERTFRCSCGLVMDRDLNAARNLEAFGANVAGGRSETKNGRGGEHRLDPQSSPMKRQGGSGQPHRTVLVGSK
ncbi:MAG TPA: IS607 family element RNA-guided endonuclease TnpB [Acidimicrobiales bacterium]